MLIAFIIILVLGFINPSFWFLFVFLVAYFLLTMKSRSKKAVEIRIIHMLMLNEAEHHYPELFFEATESYARNYGINFNRTANSASCIIIFRNKEYMVFFTKVERVLGGGTYITIYDYRESINERLNQF